MNTSLQNLAMYIIFLTGNPCDHVLETPVSGRHSIYCPPQRRGRVHPKAIHGFSNQSPSAILLDENKMFTWNSSEKQTTTSLKELQPLNSKNPPQLRLASESVCNPQAPRAELTLNEFTLWSPLVSSYKFSVTQNYPLCNMNTYFKPDNLYNVPPQSLPSSPTFIGSRDMSEPGHGWHLFLISPCLRFLGII